MTDPFLLLGIAGMVCILYGFLMVQTHRWSEDSTIYDALNFIGAALLVFYALSGRAWPFVVLNAVWALYSLKDIFLDLKKASRS